jgi:ribosomal protein S18 acetylase RimI-like enzyme
VSTNFVGIDTLTIRGGRPDDAAALTALAIRSKASWGYDDAFMRKAHGDMRVTAPDIQSSHCLVAEHDGAICGYVLTFVNAEGALLRDLFIDPAYFGRGLGRELFQRAIAHARECHARRVVLHADPNARGFYERLGMQCTSEVNSSVVRGRKLPVMELIL